VYEEEGVIHYGVPNQPGAVPRTSTMALAQGNIDYILLKASLSLIACSRPLSQISNI
jgi:alanine dehydrogenase